MISVTREYNHRLLTIGFCTLLVLQLVAALYHTVSLPLQYDEWFSWRFFSGNSFTSVLFEYPAPNNHIFYNVTARIFILTGIPPETAVRLPAVIASMLSVYFMFRLCSKFFPGWQSLLIVAALVANFQFAVFSANARAYGFVFLCCIVLLYAVTRVYADYSDRRARMFFIVSLFFGTWTVPSFIYVLVVPCSALFVGLCLRRRWKDAGKLALDGILGGLLIVAGYSGILFFGDPSVLLNPEHWTSHFILDTNWLSNVAFYYKELLKELFPFVSVPFCLVITAIAAVVGFVRNDRQGRFVVIVCTLMFFLPPVIVLVHKVYPFSRSLAFIIVPTLILWGFLFRELIAVFRIRRVRNGALAAVMVLACGISLCGFAGVNKRYRDEHGWEYRLESLRKGVLRDRMSKLRSVGRTAAGTEFYAAEIILFMAATENSDLQYELRSLGMPQGEDLLVIHNSLLGELQPHLAGYQLILAYADIFVFASERFMAE